MGYADTETRLFRKGLGLKENVQEPLRKDYKGLLVDYAREHAFTLKAKELTFRLAKEFGFCYGVDRAVEYAYEARSRFPNRRITITGEIIHNPYVNQRLSEMGVEFLVGEYGTDEKFSGLTKDDVVLLPAFGVSTEELTILNNKGSILVDTTCGSVMNVWKNVERYAKRNFTSLVHGKYGHEETKATVSRATHSGGPYLVVRDKSEAELVCNYIKSGDDPIEFIAMFRNASSPGFDPDRHLSRIGVANQTTMLSSESLEIARMVKQAMEHRYGETETATRFISFDTICSATQERQDAVIELCEEGVNIMIVIGGYNSSNTTHLAELCESKFPTFHISDSSCLISNNQIRHKPTSDSDEFITNNWLPNGSLKIGITAGASTPDIKVDETIEKVLSFRGMDKTNILG